MDANRQQLIDLLASRTDDRRLFNIVRRNQDRMKNRKWPYHDVTEAHTYLDSVADLVADLLRERPLLTHKRNNIGVTYIAKLRKIFAPELDMARRGELVIPVEGLQPEPTTSDIEQRLLAALREFIREELRKEGADHMSSGGNASPSRSVPAVMHARRGGPLAPSQEGADHE